MNHSLPSSPARPFAGRGPRSRSALVACLLAAACALPLAGAVAADLPTPSEARQVNDDTVGIVFHYEDIYRQLVADMAGEFEKTSEVRVVPIIGRNHVQTIYDMLYMKGVDLGIVHSDVLEYMARVMGYDRVYVHIKSLVEVWSEKVAVIAGEGYESLEDLAGRKVNFREEGKGSDVTGTILFDTLGIEVEKTRFGKLEALEKVLSGEIAAMVYLIEEPLEEFTRLSSEEGVRLIEIPRDERLLELYRAAELTAEEFPELIGEDEAVSTVSVPVIIAAYNWPESDAWRYGKSRRFVDALVANLDSLGEGDRAEIWQEVSLEKDVPGVERLPLVDTVLEEQRALEERLVAEAAAEKAAALRARQERLVARLTDRIENSADTAELAELERLIEQLQKILDGDS